jgi:hypothetical protein
LSTCGLKPGTNSTTWRSGTITGLAIRSQFAGGERQVGQVGDLLPAGFGQLHVDVVVLAIVGQEVAGGVARHKRPQRDADLLRRQPRSLASSLLILTLVDGLAPSWLYSMSAMPLILRILSISGARHGVELAFVRCRGWR